MQGSKSNVKLDETSSITSWKLKLKTSVLYKMKCLRLLKSISRLCLS